MRGFAEGYAILVVVRYRERRVESGARASLVPYSIDRSSRYRLCILLHSGRWLREFAVMLPITVCGLGVCSMC